MIQNISAKLPQTRLQVLRHSSFQMFVKNLLLQVLSSKGKMLKEEFVINKNIVVDYCIEEYKCVIEING